MTSESDTCREELMPYLSGIGMDVGFGGSAIVPHAITFDKPNPYTSVGQDGQILRGDCVNLWMFCDNALFWIFSSHLIEDWTYPDQRKIINEWRRVLKPGGLLLTNAPDQSKFLAHCAKTGQPLNLAHKESTMGFETFKSEVLDQTGPWETVWEKPVHGAYSFLSVVRKV